MITIDNLTKMFGALTAVDALSFEVRDGEVVGLLGPNGAGKTTTIRCIAGLLNPSKGSVVIDGHDILREAEEAKRLALITSDQRLMRAANAEGVATVNPETVSPSDLPGILNSV